MEPISKGRKGKGRGKRRAREGWPPIGESGSASAWGG